MKKGRFISRDSKFSEILLRWHRDENTRQMPWKGVKDPYKVWLSEIILQQTRVEQGLAYYNRFLENFPNIIQLADAPDAKVFKLWEGLGYYSRCRNLLHTARYIASEKKGKFPDSHDEIRSLKGVGAYTAAAIASFAFDQPHAVVDGNVYRVLARIFGIDTPIDSTEGKKYFTQLANDLLTKGSPAEYNQAIMDFGAVVCKPVSPLCNNCVFKKDCVAFNEGRINELPVKAKKTAVRKRWFYYLVLEKEGKLAIQQRTGKDIWNQLYQFPMVESLKDAEINAIVKQATEDGLLKSRQFQLGDISAVYKQTLSHQIISGQFIHIKISGKPDAHPLVWLKKTELKDFAFPKIINDYLQGKSK